jgi:hypothetical protein
MEDSGIGNEVDYNSVESIKEHIRNPDPKTKELLSSLKKIPPTCIAPIRLLKAILESEERRQKLKRIRLKHGLDKE